MSTIAAIVAGTYGILGLALFVWISISDIRKTRITATNYFLGLAFFHPIGVLFAIVLWPLILLCYLAETEDSPPISSDNEKSEK